MSPRREHRCPHSNQCTPSVQIHSVCQRHRQCRDSLGLPGTMNIVHQDRECQYRFLSWPDYTYPSHTGYRRELPHHYRNPRDMLCMLRSGFHPRLGCNVQGRRRSTRLPRKQTCAALLDRLCRTSARSYPGMCRGGILSKYRYHVSHCMSQVNKRGTWRNQWAKTAPQSSSGILKERRRQ